MSLRSIFPLLVVFLVSGCANFIKLGQNLNFMDETIILTGQIKNADEFSRVKVFVVDWDREKGKIHSVDYSEVKGLAVFGFFVEKSGNHYMMAWSDANGNDQFDDGEPAWSSHDDQGRFAPVVHRPERPDAVGYLKRKYQYPADLVGSAQEFYAGRHRSEVKTGWSIPISLGEEAKLNEDRFSSEGAAAGYWEPAAYPIKTGMGLYFHEKFDPNRIPVVFVHGAAGSPRDFETFFEKFDRKRFQLWFYHYPSGRRLAEMGGGLDKGLRLLKSHYNFKEVHVVAHSMGGLVARNAILKNLEAGSPCVGRFVSISSPFGGQENAASGVKHAPSVVPSWRDIEPGSEFLEEVFKDKLLGDVDHLLIYGHRASRVWGLPSENDGTLSVASMAHGPALKDAVDVKKFDEDHMSILSNPAVIREVERFLKAGQ